MSSSSITSLETAERWATRLDAGPLSSSEEESLTAWLAEDPLHPVQMEASRELLARLADSVTRQAGEGRFPAVIQPSRHVFRRFAIGLAAAAALAATWWTLRPEQFSTPAAQRSSVLLADGSRVDLNARTSLAVRLRADGRQVVLNDGEAYFAVAKDPSRPFVITTSFGAIRVTGTAFNVRATEGDCEVTVVEGTVEVTPVQGSLITLRVGDQFRLLQGHVFQRHLSDEAARDAAAWREGRVVFESEPLGSAVARFARYHQRAVIVAPDAASIEIGGSFQLTEFDGFLSDLSLGFPVTVLKQTDGSIRILRRGE